LIGSIGMNLKLKPAPWLLVVGIIVLCTGLGFQQHIRKAHAAATNYPSAASATYTPDTLLW
jgi:hypothetical protein